MPSFANQAVLSSLFGRQANAFGDAINAAIRGHQKEALQHDAGHRFVVLAFRDSIRVSDPVLNLEGSSRVCIHYIDWNADNCDALQSQITLRLDIPTKILRNKSSPLFWLYNIRFQLKAEDSEVDARGMRPFRVGYFGITKRSVFERFKEHEAKVISGAGHTLHTAWRALIASGMPFHPVVQVSATSKSLDAIYAFEETAVAQRSLAPLGLNAIPGGYAGIRMLHQLALLSGKPRALPDARDRAMEALERSSTSKTTHYRVGHIRNLPTGKTTWVSPCWVNLDHEVSLT